MKTYYFIYSTIKCSNSNEHTKKSGKKSPHAWLAVDCQDKGNCGTSAIKNIPGGRAR